MRKVRCGLIADFTRIRKEMRFENCCVWFRNLHEAALTRG